MAGDRWLFTQSQIAASPSRKGGIDADRELNYRQQTANMIQDMGQRLQVSQLCINTAIVYMHRFYMFHSFSKFTRANMAAACLFLAAKVEEQPRKLEHVIKVAHVCFHRDQGALDTNSEKYLEQARDLVVNENILLQTLGFEVTVDHPHSHIVKTCSLIRASKDLAQTSYFLATNSLHLTTMTLELKPTVVAAVCINLACKWANFLIPKSSEGKEWFTYVDPALTSSALEKMTSYFLSVLDKAPSKLKKKLMGHRAQEEKLTGSPQNFHTPPPDLSLDIHDSLDNRSTPSTSSSHSVSHRHTNHERKDSRSRDSIPATITSSQQTGAAETESSSLRRVKTESFIPSLTHKEYLERKEKEKTERERVERERQKIVSNTQTSTSNVHSAKREPSVSHSVKQEPKTTADNKEWLPPKPEKPLSNIFDTLQSEVTHKHAQASAARPEHRSGDKSENKKWNDRTDSKSVKTDRHSMNPEMKPDVTKVKHEHGVPNAESLVKGEHRGVRVDGAAVKQESREHSSGDKHGKPSTEAGSHHRGVKHGHHQQHQHGSQHHRPRPPGDKHASHKHPHHSTSQRPNHPQASSVPSSTSSSLPHPLASAKMLKSPPPAAKHPEHQSLRVSENVDDHRRGDAQHPSTIPPLGGSAKKQERRRSRSSSSSKSPIKSPPLKSPQKEAHQKPRPPVLSGSLPDMTSPQSLKLKLPKSPKKALPPEIKRLQNEAKTNDPKVMLKRLSPHTMERHLSQEHDEEDLSVRSMEELEEGEINEDEDKSLDHHHPKATVPLVKPGDYHQKPPSKSKKEGTPKGEFTIRPEFGSKAEGGNTGTPIREKHQTPKSLESDREKSTLKDTPPSAGGGLKLKVNLKSKSVVSAEGQEAQHSPPPLPLVPTASQEPSNPFKIVLSKDKVSGHYSSSSHHKHKSDKHSRKRVHSPSSEQAVHAKRHHSSSSKASKSKQHRPPESSNTGNGHSNLNSVDSPGLGAQKMPTQEAIKEVQIQLQELISQKQKGIHKAQTATPPPQARQLPLMPSGPPPEQPPLPPDRPPLAPPPPPPPPMAPPPPPPLPLMQTIGHHSISHSHLPPPPPPPL